MTAERCPNGCGAELPPDQWQGYCRPRLRAAKSARQRAAAERAAIASALRFASVWGGGSNGEQLKDLADRLERGEAVAAVERGPLS